MTNPAAPIPLAGSDLGDPDQPPACFGAGEEPSHVHLPFLRDGVEPGPWDATRAASAGGARW